MSDVLTLGISTFGNGVNRIRLPAPRSGLRVVVVWQEPSGPAPVWSDRQDVRLVTMQGRGLSRSRNAVLAATETPFLWFFDDDAVPLVDNAFALVEVARREGWALATGTVITPEGGAFKRYGAVQKQWNVFGAPKVSSIETVIDIEKVRHAGIAFDERFGLGAQWTMGEEFVFVASVLRSGLKAGFAPLCVAEHPLESTGKDFGRAEVWQASSAALKHVFGRWALPVRVAMAWRKRRALGWSNAWRYLWVRL